MIGPMTIARWEHWRRKGKAGVRIVRGRGADGAVLWELRHYRVAGEEAEGVERFFAPVDFTVVRYFDVLGNPCFKEAENHAVPSASLQETVSVQHENYPPEDER